MITKEELDFLRESNNIENEWDDMSLQDSILAWEYIKTKKQLTKEDILKTHKILMRTRDTIDNEERGSFRKVRVWVGDREGSSPQDIIRQMKIWTLRANVTANLVRLPKDTDEEYKKVREDRIKTDHIVYEKIHPFIDGNGRTGRILMNWQRVRVGLPILIIKASERQKYYEWFK